MCLLGLLCVMLYAWIGSIVAAKRRRVGVQHALVSARHVHGNAVIGEGARRVKRRNKDIVMHVLCVVSQKGNDLVALVL